MLVDSHVHLQPHGQRPPISMATIERYVDAALANGLDGLVITEHLFRFWEAYDLLAGWWEADPNPRLAATAAAYWRDHVNLRIVDYVELVQEAKSRGLPVFLGLEMDWLTGKADALRRILAPHAWDVVLGSVHWIGAFGFDSGEEVDMEEWARRDPDDVFTEYAQLIGELADSHLADVLAHPDVPKLFGHKPRDFAAFHGKILTAAVRGGCALEINTNGLRKVPRELYPAPALLETAHHAGVPVTLASDAHTPDRLGQAFDIAITAARAAGYDHYTRFVRRERVPQPFSA
ncbi:MAG: histidinol-phosphatase HisJ family protein [Dehalococcoidia bacterium]